MKRLFMWGGSPEPPGTKCRAFLHLLPLAFAVLIALAILSSFAAERGLPAGKAGPSVTITVLNPQGPVKKVKDLAPRLGTLKGKKIALWLSSTADEKYAGRGAELYDTLSKMLKDKFPGIQIVPYTGLPMKFAPEKDVLDAITAAKPDGVVAAFGG